MLSRGGAKLKPLLVLILLGAVLVRVPVAILMGDQVAVLPGIYDQVSYDALAQNLLADQGYSFSQKWYPFTPANTPTAHWSFLYPLFLAGVYGLVGYHPLVARLIQAVGGGVLVCYLVYLIGRKVDGEKTGLIAATIAAFYGYFAYYNAALMTETFFMLCVLLALYLSLGLRDKPILARWIALGLVLGIASLLRQTILLFAPFLFAWLFWELRGERIRRWGFIVAGAVIVLCILPWTIRNYNVYGQFLLLNSNAGYALYASNNPNLETDWRDDEVVVPIPEELSGLNEAALDRALTMKGFEFIRADPGRYFLLNLDKSLEFFKFWPSSASSAISNLNRILSFGLWLPFMLVGLWLSFPSWRRFAPLYIFIAVHSGIHLLTWPSPRYRLPVDAVLMVFAALAVSALARWLGEVRRRPARQSRNIRVLRSEVDL